MPSIAQIAVAPEQALALLQSAGALFEGHFLLSSGLHSGQYFQCAKLLENPPVAAQIAEALAKVCAAWNVDVVLSPAVGGILVGYELSRVLGCRNIFAERPSGRFELRRGFSIRPGERVLMAENVITTGGSVLEAAEVVKNYGGEIVGYAVIVDRSGGRFAPEQPVVAYGAFDAQAFTPDQCPLCAKGIPVEKPGSRSFESQKG